MAKSLPPESDANLSLDEAIARGLSAVAAAAESLGAGGAPIACREIGRVFDTAIEHGAPIWNRGSQLGCAQIYLHSAKGILAALSAAKRASNSGVNEVLDALRQVAKACPTATLDNANKLGWAMRSIFDRFHAARGIEDVDQLIEATRAGGGAIDLDLVNLVLSVAVAHGNTLYQANALDICADLHAHTARRILELLEHQEKSAGTLPPRLSLMRRKLAPLLAHPAADAEARAWNLYEVFQEILQLTPEEKKTPQAAASGEYNGFISYRRSSGSDAALALRAYLQMRGLNTFLDLEGMDSGVFGPRLMRAIEQAPSFLLILSPGSLERCRLDGDWLRREIGHAIQTKRNIIPILKDGFQFPEAETLPADIRILPEYQAVTYSLEFFAAAIDRIEKFMRQAEDR